MADVNIRLNLEMSPRLFRGFFPLLLLSVLAGDLASEAVTLNTYYPAPSGIYTSMISTSHTYLARDGGYVAIGTSVAPTAGTKLAIMGAAASQHLVGIGTAAPGAALEVAYPPGGNQAAAVNGRIMTGDASNQGGVFLNAAQNQFVGRIDNTIATAFYPFSMPGSQTIALKNNASILSINANGYVGVGHTTPGAPLDVYGIMTARTWTPVFTAP